jgi:hypothetical protein
MDYYKYSRYAKKFSEHLSGDIVHDIYLRYMLRHGRNIFEEKFSNRRIFLIVKNQFINSLHGSWRMVSRISASEAGEEGKRAYDPDDDDAGMIPAVDVLLSTDPDAVDEMLAKELDAMFQDQLLRAVVKRGKRETLLVSDKDNRKDVILDVYKLMALNFKNVEIAQELGVSEQLVGYYKTQIRGNMAKNPFNGDKTVVRGVITKKVWRTRKNKDRRERYELIDYNEYYELYRHKETGVGLLVKIEHKETINPYLLGHK